MKPTKVCSFEGCGRPFYAKDLCNGHYIQHRKGQELRPLRPSSRGRPLEQRFWVKVKKTPGCWEWTAATTSNGYGQFSVDGRYRRAHRVAWEMTNGPIPEGMELDHRCANKRCVNPAHLRVTTRSQNMQHRTINQRNNTSGVRGVTWNKRAKAWQAYAQLNGRRHHGGLHPTLEAADKAARALRAELFTHDDHEKWPQRQGKAS